DWSSDVCSSDLLSLLYRVHHISDPPSQLVIVNRGTILDDIELGPEHSPIFSPNIEIERPARWLNHPTLHGRLASCRSASLHQESTHPWISPDILEILFPKE